MQNTFFYSLDIMIELKEIKGKEQKYKNMFLDKGYIYRRTKHQNAPKKPLNAYQLFIKENRNKIVKEYTDIKKVPEIIKKYGGEYLARGGEYTVVEGEDNYPRIILIKFPSYEKALEWYHSEDYKIGRAHV